MGLLSSQSPISFVSISICKVETFNLEPIQQASKLSVLIPARVEPLPHSGQIQMLYFSAKFPNCRCLGQYTVREGSSLTLECRASGNPAPVITWTRTSAQTEARPGDLDIQGPAVTIGGNT